MTELAEVYLKMEGLIEDFRIEWEKDHAAGLRRKESYWQGKKDGLRIALTMFYPFVRDELTQE
ncbi:MAG: hypothetical protein ACYSW6_05870 [Planctomycetota bacterium]|jgi:hypothetical protein